MSVFISYRRDGGMPIAREIYNELSKQYDVFFDVESLRNGYFDTAIVQQIEKCSDFIVIITETVFDRCSEPNDWILHEAMTALCENKNIIPIFVGTTSFPSNVPESLRKMCRFNGIFWSDTVTSCARIKSFLISNRRYILSVVRNQDSIRLATKTKIELKGLYERFLKNGRLPVDVKIEIQNVKDLALLSMRKDIVESSGFDVALHFAEQYVLKKKKSLQNVLEFAFEYLFLDEMLDTCASRMRDYYVTLHGAKECIFIDSDGTENDAITPYLWIDIIEELLKELITDRFFVYGNSRDYFEIDCWIKNRNGSEIWMFSTFVPHLQDDKLFKVFINNVFADYIDIPVRVLAFHIYPDLYYNIGLLKANLMKQSYDEVKNKCDDVFNLLNYSFGLH